MAAPTTDSVTDSIRNCRKTSASLAPIALRGPISTTVRRRPPTVTCCPIAYVHVPDLDALAAEFASRNVELSVPLRDTDDGLRGFELKDADGYVLFFGRPR